MFPLKIISLKETLFDGRAVSVNLPSSEGELTILKDHLPLITALKKGRIKVKDGNNQEHSFEIQRGFLEVNPNKVTILTQ
jgi:F-type H+-transporting ATPase subunit epsilon